MHEILTGIGIKIQGHLKILEYASHQDYVRGLHARVLLNKRNAVHKENAAITIAKAIANHTNGTIAYMVFGNGGSTLDPTGTVLFNSPNDTGLTANLYNPVFFQLVDDTLGALPGNQMASRHISNSMFTDVDIRCLVGVNEPFGQLPSNIGTGINLNTNTFVFDEIGLKLIDGTLLTHVVFSPVLKTANTLLEVIYTLRIAVGQPPGSLPATTFFLEGVESLAESGPFAGNSIDFEMIGEEVITEFNGFEHNIYLPGQEVISAQGDLTPPFLGCGHPAFRSIIVSNAGLTVQGGSAGGPELAQTCGVAAGQFYFEVNMDSGATIDACAVGIAIPTADENDVNSLWVGGVGYNTQGRIDLDGVTQSLLNGNIAPGGVLGVAVDTINHRIYFYANRSPDDAAHIPASLPSFQPAIGNFGAVNFASFGTDDFCLTILFKAGTADKFTVVNSSFTYPPPIGYGFGWGGVIPDEATYLALDPVASVNVTFGINNYACIGSGSIASGTRSITSYSIGKRYFEFMKEGMVWNGSWAAIIDSTQSVTGGLSGTHGKGLVGAGGGLGNLIDNAVGQVAVDVGAKLLWIRPTGSGNWNNNALADPATGVGGASLATLTGPIYFGMGTAAPGGFGAAERMLFISNPNYFKYSVPAGFTPGF